LNAGEGNDIITGITPFYLGFYGLNNSGTLNTEEGDDIITGRADATGLNNSGTLNTGEGNDTITSTNSTSAYQPAMYNSGSIDTSDGNDIIAATGRSIGIDNNRGTINTGNGEDSIISRGNLINRGGVFLGDGNDSISVDRYYAPYYAVVENFNFIGTGDGNDTITSTGIIYNEGVIETGNGDDSIIVDIDTEGTGIRYGIKNNGGAINMGDGNDSIIANEGFESGYNSSGAWFLGEGDDYIKGFGSGDFYGGNGNDTLELTPGTYTVGIWGEAGESPIFTKGNQLMITSEFEKLKAGNTLYDFTSLTAGQIITVA